jgi:hypothetical protein
MPSWVAVQFGLPEGATYSSLGSEVWSNSNQSELPPQIKKFLINLTATRRSSIWNLQVLTSPWPHSLDPGVLPWSIRTKNCLHDSGLLKDVARISTVTFGHLLSLRALGVRSALDFACVAEIANDVAKQPESTASIEIAGDYVDTLLEAIDAPWSAEVSYLDPRFAGLLSPGHQTVLERLEHLTAEPQDSPLAQVELAREILKVRERLAEISNQPLDSALIHFVEEVTRLRGTGLKALTRRLGVTGTPPATLEEAAAVIGVTRERVRQIQKRFNDHLPNHPVFMPKLDDAIAIVRKSAPITVEGAAELIRTQGITTGPFHPQSLLVAAEFCKRQQPFEIDSSTGVPRVVLEYRKDVERTVYSVACKQAGASGATNIAEVIAEVGTKIASSPTEDEVRRFLQQCPEVEFLDERWFWHKDGIPERNRLRNVTRKMLSVASSIHFTDLRDGVQRYLHVRRTRGIAQWPLVTPPRAILEAFYRAHPEFAVDVAGQVTSVVPLDQNSELNPTERILVDILRSSPACLLDRGSFGKTCTDLGMNPNTFSQLLQSSPVIAHIGTDLWSLRGIKVDPASVEALRQANAATPREKRIIDHGWTENGDLWFSARLPELRSAFVLGVPSSIRRFVAGQEFPAADELGLAAGTVRINAEGTASYGFGQFLSRYGADEDDVLLITFKLAERKATLRLVSAEESENLSPT